MKGWLLHFACSIEHHCTRFSAAAARKDLKGTDQSTLSQGYPASDKGLLGSFPWIILMNSCADPNHTHPYLQLICIEEDLIKKMFDVKLTVNMSS